MPADFTIAYPLQAELGEGLQWHAPSGRWWWTDIEGACLHAWTPGTRDLLTVQLPERVGSFVHTRSGGLLLGMAKRLAWLKLDSLRTWGTVTGHPQTLVPVEPDSPSTRINDGRCDRSGHYVFGTLDEARPRQPIGHFYQYSQAHGLRPLALPGVAIANSIAFSVDGRRMYYCDTLERCIRVCNYDAAGAHVSRVCVFAHLDVDDAWPDGSTVDTQDGLWNAEWGHGSVAHYAPDGRRLARLRVPVPNVSCPAFGGADGGDLLVTTARQELSAQQRARLPLSGSLFEARPAAVRGLPETLFDDRDPP